MAPAKRQGNVYYPVLAECFSGEQQLLSWEAVYAALCDPDTASTSDVLRDFLSDDATIDILSKPLNPYPAPNQTSKSKFETDTAPINVTASSTGDYNLDEIKADSLWLSQQTQIDEPAALRIAILEWQGRPAAQVLGGFTEEEAISVQEAAGVANLGASTFVANSSILAAPLAEASSKFDSADQRKLRLLSIYLSERVYILRISQVLICWSSASRMRQKYGNEYRVCDEWLEKIGENIINTQKSKRPNRETPFLADCLKAIDTVLTNLDKGSQWKVPESIEEAVYVKWRTSQATELVHILHLTVAHIDLFTPKFVPAGIILDWFKSMAERNFFLGLQMALPDQQPLVELIHVLVSLISLIILKLPLVIQDLESGEFSEWEQSTFVLNGTLIEELTNTFGYAAKELGPHPGTPAAFAWSIIIYRLSVQTRLIEEEHDDQPASHGLEEALQQLSRVDPDTFGTNLPYAVLAEACSNHEVFGLISQLIGVGMSAFGTNMDRISRDRMRLAQLELLRASLGSEIVAYSPETILVAITILAGNRSFWEWVDNAAEGHFDPVAAHLLQDTTVLRPALLDEAQLRYPYETVPLIKFCSVLTRGETSSYEGLPVVATILLTTDTLMQQLPAGFSAYRSIREEENANFVALEVDLPQFATQLTSTFGTQQRRLMGTNSSTSLGDSMVIPAGTEGRIVDDTAQPFITVWHYRHSALKFLVALLSTRVVGSKQVDFASQEPTSLENATEIVGFFADLINSSVRASKRLDDGGTSSTELLEALDIGTDQGQDTVSIVLSIFEQELLNLAQQPGNETSLELLVNCTHFVYALIAISPARVWPWLARSRLLESDGNGGSLASILIGTEMVLGRYDFLIGCIRMFHSLVEDAVERSVARRAPSKAIARFGINSSSGSGSSEKVMSNTLLTFGRTLASIYETSLSWKYNNVKDRLLINIGLTNVFTAIFEHAYSVDDSSRLSTKLSGLLAPVAEYLTDLFVSDAENDLPTNPILASLLSSIDFGNPSIRTNVMELWAKQTRSALRFSKTIIHVAVLLNRPWTHLEQQLFKATPLLARLYATNDTYKTPVVALFESLVRGAVRSTESSPSGASNKRGGKVPMIEPPSLLGHLGPRTAKNFLSILSLLDKPLKIIDIQTNVWNLLSAVVSCKQQWFALYLLTGTTPRESIRNKSPANSGSKGKALLTHALDKLSSIDLSNPRKTVAMLEFVSLAQNNWSWAMSGLRQHKNFIQGLLSFLTELNHREPKTDVEIIQKAYQNRIASLIAEILAMYLHSSRQIGDLSPIKDIVPCLDFYAKSALQLPSYNHSLHANLKRNIETRFPGCSLENFKRTTLHTTQFGQNYFYDLDLADKLLSFNASWKGRRDQGFYQDVVRSNINLSLVESQVQLLYGWKLLAAELSCSVTKNNDLPKLLANVVRDCMLANTESNLPEALFGRLMFVRAELAFALLQKMVTLNVEGEGIVVARRLLLVIWNAIRASTSDFDAAFSTEHVDYYRLLLRILYLSLHFHRASPSTSAEDLKFRESFRASVSSKDNRLIEPISNQLLEITSEVVAKGFRNLATQVHEDPASVSPADFGLLTAILQAILRIPEMINWHAQAGLIFANSNTVRYATSLFSWSDRLAIESAGASTPDPIYGELSLLFLLSLSSMQFLAENMAVEGILSQLDTANILNYYRRPNGIGPFDAPARLFSIWTRGILPLMLNLLHAVGAPIAGEIATFLNEFPQQLKRASNALNPRLNPRITLALASEAHSLALIHTILESFRIQGPALGIQSSDIPALEWENESVNEDLENWLGKKGSLRERIVTGDERDVELAGRRADGNAGDLDGETELERRVVEELSAAHACLGAGSGGSQA